MHPTFRVDGITGAFTGPNGRGVSLVVVDQVSVDGDFIDVVIDDRDGDLPIPAIGTEVSAFMGYVETGASFMGTFYVSEVMLEGWPRQITVHCTGHNDLSTIKSPRT